MNSPRRSWPYAITAVLIMALQEGWRPGDVRALAATMLLFVAMIYASGDDRH